MKVNALCDVDVAVEKHDNMSRNWPYIPRVQCGQTEHLWIPKAKCEDLIASPAIIH